MRRLVALPLVALLSASSLYAQALRGAPQVFEYRIKEPTNLTITELAVPIFALVPIRSGISLDVGSAYAWAHVTTTGSAAATSTITGVTDTQVRTNFTLGTDFLLMTASVNLPTGRATAAAAEQLAAGLIGSDFLAFPISNMGSGFGGTAGLAFAHPMAAGWSVGAGFSMRRSAGYEPFSASGGKTALRYQPGNEYRGRVGLDHPLGTGRVSVGFTYSSFGDDNIGGSIYNTGNRYIGELGVSNTMGVGSFSLTAFNMFRTSGTLADSSTLGHENLTSAVLVYSIPSPLGVLEPMIEARTWTQDQAPMSDLVNVGLRYRFSLGRLVIAPSAGYAIGRLASQTTAGVATTAALTGFRGVLTMRIGE